MSQVPFAPLPLKAMKKVSAPFTRFGSRIEGMFPALNTQLNQAGIDLSAREYCAIIVFTMAFYFALFSVIISMLLSKMVFTSSLIGSIAIPHFALLGLAIGLAVSALVGVQLIAYPKIHIKKRIRAMESNLVYALRTMLVQIKSGEGLFEALSTISSSNRFGELSREIKKTVDSINAGSSEESALKELASKNPSPYLRKVIRQLLNGMSSGADISDVLAESISSIVREQRIGIQGYGSSLRVLSLMYLMIGIIIPALSLTFLIVLGSFPKIKISESLFWLMLGGIILAEFMFIGIIKSKRPNLMSN